MSRSEFANVFGEIAEIEYAVSSSETWTAVPVIRLPVFRRMLIEPISFSVRQRYLAPGLEPNVVSGIGLYVDFIIFL